MADIFTNPRWTLALALVLAASICSVHPQSTSQTFTLLSTATCGGNGFGMGERYGYDLSTFGHDNFGRSVEGVGNWIFYDLPGYQGTPEVVILRNWECNPLRELGARASSVRFVGNNLDYGANSITLYQGPNFSGREQHIEADHPKTLFGDDDGPDPGFRAPFGSFIVTGNSTSCWTLYEAAGHYELRDKICVCGMDTSDYQPLLAWSNPFPPNNHIGSVKQGCVSGEAPVATTREGSRDGVFVVVKAQK